MAEGAPAGPDEALRRALLDLRQAQTAYVEAYRAWESSERPDAAEAHLAAMREWGRRADEARADAGRWEREAATRVDVRTFDL